MFCPKCGMRLDDGATSCPGCGAPLPERAAPRDGAPVGYAAERRAVRTPTTPIIGKSVRSIIYLVITLLFFLLLAHLLGLTGESRQTSQDYGRAIVVRS